jgi:hypothetical protein
MKVKKGLKKSKKSYRRSSKNDLISNILYTSAGFVAGNFAANIVDKMLIEKTENEEKGMKLSFVAPAVGIGALSMNLVKLPNESAIMSGLIASMLTRLLKDEVIPKTKFTQSVLGGEPDVFVLSGDNVDPLGNLMLEENYPQTPTEFVVNGQNSDPLS